MKFPDFPKDGVCNFFCGRAFVEGPELGHFCEPRYYYD